MLFNNTEIFNYDSAHPSCHCSMIQELPNGQLMVVWYAGKSEAHKTVGIKASWKDIKIDGTEWEAPQLIHKTPGRADGNEIIAYYNGKLYLYFNVIMGRLFPWTSVILKQKVSEDFGKTWSEPKVLIGEDNKGYTVRNKAIQIGKKLIIPTGSENLKTSYSQMLITTNGENYHFSDKILLEGGKSHQPTIVELDNGDILAYLRTNMNKIYLSRSSDQGETWTSAVETKLDSPNSALDMVLTPKGELVVVWNNNPRVGGHKKSRKALHIGYSPDGGNTWPIIKEIERDDENGRFAYPSIIIGSDKNFHLTYSNRRKNIKYCVFDMEWLKK